MSENYYIVPRYEDTGIKELRVSTKPYTPWRDGEPCGVNNAVGRPLESMTFASMEAAMSAINNFAPHLAP